MSMWVCVCGGGRGWRREGCADMQANGRRVNAPNLVKGCRVVGLRWLVSRIRPCGAKHQQKHSIINNLKTATGSAANEAGIRVRHACTCSFTLYELLPRYLRTQQVFHEYDWKQCKRCEKFLTLAIRAIMHTLSSTSEGAWPVSYSGQNLSIP